ncbi:MAG: zf-HC2 domain-containing protein [Planctomycetota bacterium]|nr:zf-HC2 domain-containing protein [Planctomycetota bacterium]
MICPNETEWVLYASGELPPSRRQALESHLAGCDACRREAESLARGLAALATLERTPAVRPEVMKTLRDRARTASGARPAVVSIRRRYRWVAAAAAVVVLAIGAATFVPTICRQAADPWVTDTHVQEEIAEITAGVEMLEGYATAKTPEAAPAAPDDQTFEELEFFFNQLRAEVDA